MSCVFRDPNGRIVVMCKGADSVIEELLSQESRDSDEFISTQKSVNEFAS
jgi:magnesium-transporting ATPase (P-type)